MTELCRVDGEPVLVNIFRGSGLCCVNCQKEEEKLHAAYDAEHAARRAQEDLDRCRGGNPRCRRRKPARIPAAQEWHCHDHEYQA